MKKLISLMALSLLCISAYAQQTMLSGRVTDADGLPVIGAVIWLRALCGMYPWLMVHPNARQPHTLSTNQSFFPSALHRLLVK